MCSTAAGCLLVGLSIRSSLLHSCGEESRGEMAFKQRKRVNGQCFATDFSSGFGILFSDLSQAWCVIPVGVSNLLSQFFRQSKDNNNNVGENCRI